jgi:hypothetical protein
MFRSCYFRSLCYDSIDQDFVLFHNPGRENATVPLSWQPYSTRSSPDETSFEGPSAISLGGINPRWSPETGRGFHKGLWKVRWFPRIVTIQDTKVPFDAYQLHLPDDQVFVLFHSFAAQNVGHLLWDDFFSIYKLLRWFDLLPMGPQARGASPTPHRDAIRSLLLLRYKLPFNLYASCDLKPKNAKKCLANLERFVSMIGVNATTFTTHKNVRFQNHVPTSGSDFDASHYGRYVCSRHAVAGLGVLTDHGMHDHGWIEPNSTRQKSSKFHGQAPLVGEWIPHNLGNGDAFYGFRNFVVKNSLKRQGMATAANTQLTYPQVENFGASSSSESDDVLLRPDRQRRIIFSQLSSRDHDRRWNFTAHIDFLQKRISETSSGLVVQGLRLWELSMTEQIELVSDTDIFVTTCGGGSMTASFLPRGASLIVYYNATGGYNFSSHSLTGFAARLDWDLLNNAAHLRVHWIPVTGHFDMDENASPEHLELLYRLIQHELVALRNL